MFISISRLVMTVGLLKKIGKGISHDMELSTTKRSVTSSLDKAVNQKKNKAIEEICGKST